MDASTVATCSPYVCRVACVDVVDVVVNVVCIVVVRLNRQGRPSKEIHVVVMSIAYFLVWVQKLLSDHPRSSKFPVLPSAQGWTGARVYTMLHDKYWIPGIRIQLVF
jgi:hypothetical protein